MCGIVGFWDKTGDERGAVGGTILQMLNAVGCRGPDSAGVALFGAPAGDGFVIRVKLGEHGNLEPKAQEVARRAESFGAVGHFSTTGPYARFVIAGPADLGPLIESIESLGSEVEVVSAGRKLEIVKQVGSPDNLDKTYGVSQFRGTHGLGHTRLSTESRVDLSHSQPFWGHGFPDLAIVHNGHITNYHQLRRCYEQRGVRFYTENDSEIIGVYLSECLRKGLDLEQSLRSMLRDLDGSFSCLAATGSQLGFVKDPFALKPLVFAETARFVAVATEEISIRSGIPGAYDVREAQVKEVRVWQR